MSTISRPSRAALSLTADSSSDPNITLSRIMSILRDSDIPGPFQLTECHTGAKALGAGAQFDVFGKRVYTGINFPDFDGPYLKAPERWPAPEKRSPTSLDFKVEYMAVKRPRFTTTEITPGLVRLSNAGFAHAVSAVQLQQIYLEILALCHPPLRRHVNIVRLLGWGYDRPAADIQLFSPVIFVEYALCSLENLCSKADIPWAVKQHLCAGMVNGIGALHECRIVHGDIKPANILVFASLASEFSCTAKVSDFGLCAHEVGTSYETRVPRGTPGWSAPELQYSSLLQWEELVKCDIWSLGLTIWSVMSERGHVVNIVYLPSLSSAMLSTFSKVKMPAELQKTICATLSEMLLKNPRLRNISAATVYAKMTEEETELSKDDLDRYDPRSSLIAPFRT